MPDRLAPALVHADQLVAVEHVPHLVIGDHVEASHVSTSRSLPRCPPQAGTVGSARRRCDTRGTDPETGRTRPCRAAVAVRYRDVTTDSQPCGRSLITAVDVPNPPSDWPRREVAARKGAP
ncbi:hypothetical protein Cs7R123_08370 [Catellatospora sp. TT07R-123]|nr:hypothetical protein Cs7R123_08370 [Catellatospora sp. TT07R-123]